MADKYVEARNRATAKYTAAHYDTGNYKLPKGTKERIRATGETVNGFIVRAVAERLGDLPGETPQAVPVLVPREIWEALREYGEPVDLLTSGALAILEECRAGLR